MRKRPQPHARSLALVALCCAVAVSAALPIGAAGSAEETRRTMHRVFEAVQHLLPFGLSHGAPRAAGEKADVKRWSRVLVDATSTLEHHDELRPESMRYLSRSLAEDAQTLQDSYAQGELLKAQFYVLALTDNCVTCHSRLPKNRDFPLEDALVEAGLSPDLDARARIRLLVATRQFDAALDAWESLFRDAEQSPLSIDQSGGLDDYLTVAIRVQQDPDRARATLERFAGRSTLPLYLRESIDAWVASLQQLSMQPPGEPSLAAARRLVLRAEAVSTFPKDRRGRVYDLAASGLLHRVIAQPPARFEERELAESLYLLGKIEARGPGGPWVSEAESHLEGAIRLAPAEPFAVDAYALLEEYVALEYGGASGGEIPEDRRAELSELAALVAAGAPATPAKTGTLE